MKMAFRRPLAGVAEARGGPYVVLKPSHLAAESVAPFLYSAFIFVAAGGGLVRMIG
jgi:hypothetical protein